MRAKKILLIGGARPNFVKIAPLIEVMKRRSRIFEYKLIHTGQHYDYNMSHVFFKDLNIPYPHINLEIKSNKFPFTTQIALMKKELQKIFKREKPNLILVFGDCNSTVGGAIAASNLNIPLGHVEAGLRSFDRRLSEESNRLVTDILSDYLFTPSPDANQNLLNEGIPRKKIYFVGNIIIDTLVKHRKRFLDRPTLKNFNINKKQYAVLTLHRYNNIDAKLILSEILSTMFSVQEELPLIFPMHPSTRKKTKEFLPNLYRKLHSKKNIFITNPLGYLDMLNLLSNARLVLTDSGGIQEETTFLGVPCLTLRNNTERPITVTAGTNTVVGVEKASILYYFKKIMDEGFEIKHCIPLKWDGKTAERILRILISDL